MATVYQPLSPSEAHFLGTAFPQFKKVNGSGFPVPGLYYDAAADEAAFWLLEAFEYGSGNLTLTIDWYADIGTGTENVVWEAQIAVMTPNSDDADIETKALATLNFVQDTQIAGVDKRPHKATITISNLDSLAADDDVWLRIARDADGDSATDDLTGDAALYKALLAYSDT